MSVTATTCSDSIAHLLHRLDRLDHLDRLDRFDRFNIFPSLNQHRIESAWNRISIESNQHRIESTGQARRLRIDGVKARSKRETGDTRVFQAHRLNFKLDRAWRKTSIRDLKSIFCFRLSASCTLVRWIDRTFELEGHSNSISRQHEYIAVDVLNDFKKKKTRDVSRSWFTCTINRHKRRGTQGLRLLELRNIDEKIPIFVLCWLSLPCL